MTANGTSTQGLSRKHLRTGNDTSRLSGDGKNGRGENELNKKIESGVRGKNVPKGRRGGREKTVVKPDRWKRAQAAGGVLALMFAITFVLRSPTDNPPDAPSMVAPERRYEDIFLRLSPGTRFRDCASCPEMVIVPAGEFRMGASDGVTNARPAREVRVDRFALGRYEVTRGEYAEFVSATSYVVGDGCHASDDEGNATWDAAASWRAPGFEHGEDHPVVCLSWRDAQAYVRWVSGDTGRLYRLPSEAEWEYAARAGTSTRWYWGRSLSSQCNFANGGDRTLGRVFATGGCLLQFATTMRRVRHRLDHMRPTCSASLTCSATCGSGRKTAGTNTIGERHVTVRHGRTVGIAVSACCGAALGRTAREASGRISATGTMQGFVVCRVSGFGWRGRSSS